MAVAGIILAAGRSSRMGRSKALLEHDGRTFLGGIAAKLRLAGIVPVVAVVARPDADVAAEAARAGARVAFQPDPARGMLSSIHVGLALLDAPAIEAAIVWPVDHPAVADATALALLLAWERTRAAVVVPENAGRIGHPVLFARPVFAELLAADPARGARAVIEAHAADLVRVVVADPGVLLDVDTPADLARLAAPDAGQAAGDCAPRG